MRCYLIRKIASVADRDKLANLQRNLLVKHRGNDPGPDRADVGYEDQTDGASYTSALMMGCLAIALALCYGYYSKLKGAAHHRGEEEARRRQQNGLNHDSDHLMQISRVSLFAALASLIIHSTSSQDNRRNLRPTTAAWRPMSHGPQLAPVRGVYGRPLHRSAHGQPRSISRDPGACSGCSYRCSPRFRLFGFYCCDFTNRIGAHLCMGPR